MTIGYLMNTYPITSTTFIRRELHALERHGLAVKRFAIRRWSEPLVDERDTAEIARTEYLLQDNGMRLVMSFLRDLVTRPARVARAIGP